MCVILRTRGDPRTLTGAVRRELHDLDPMLPLAEVRLMDEVVSRTQARPRFLTLLLSLFSTIALVIATMGVYGVIAYTVERRTREFGVRIVLGAQYGDVVGLVMRKGAWLTLLGIAAGLAGALVLTRLMASLLFSVTPTDPATFAAVTVLLAASALLACYVPARRALRVDPIQSLHCE